MSPNPSSLKFDTERLKDGPLSVELSDPSSVDDLEDDPEYVFPDPVRLSVTLRLVGTTVLVNGTIETNARAECARCLEPVAIPLRAAVTIAFMADERLLVSEQNPEPVDDDSFYYNGEVVYPAEALRELLLLELPVVPACTLSANDICPVRKVKVEPLQFGSAAAHEPEDPAEDPDSLAAKLKRVRKEIE